MVLPNFFIEDKMKEFFTYEQQIEKLKKDGLIIADETQAKRELELEGYYNIINGYSPLFKNGTRYIKGTTFDNIKNLYDFDKNLRSIVHKYTASIECHIKAYIAHEFSRVHGVDEKKYLTAESFTENATTKESVIRLIEDCNKTIADALNEKSNKYRGYIAHNYNNHGHVPLWVLIRAIPFGRTSIFYKNMKKEEKETIAKQYFILPVYLENMLDIVVSFRNIAAHGERMFCARVYNTRLSPKLSVVKKLSIPKNIKGSNMYGKNDFLSLLICCKYLLTPFELAGLICELEAELENLAKNQNQAIFGKIKTEMGLKIKGWKLLPKLKIDEEDCKRN